MKTKKLTSVATLLLAFVSLNNQAFAQDRIPREKQGPPCFERLLSEMDTNKDNKLSKSEIKGPLKNDFSKADLNKDGFITKEEFDKMPKPKGKGPRGKN